MKKIILSGLLLLGAVTLAAYEAVILGDLHFDSEEVRDPAVKRPAYQEKEKKRNLQNWEKNIPALLDRSAKKISKETAFVWQLGDIVQGDCGSRKLHEKSLNTVLTMLQKRYSGVRFLWTPGNHDIRGKGAAEACRSVMVPYLSGALKTELPMKGAIQYALMQGKDLFIALDSNDPDLDFLEKTLAAHPERRHLFIVTHFPVIPVSQGNPGWTLGGRPDKPELRKKLIGLLAKNNAVILCAHIHCITLARWQDQRGTITQISFFSIFPEKTDTPALKPRDLKKPFPKVMDAKESKKQKQQMAVISGFLPGYKELTDIVPGAGFAVLKPGDKGITLELYNTTAGTPTHTLKLK